ncbi:hypothetical protein S40285_08069 [Stachybotrys chlorohalonatus IBT 40285]|uniref:Uncharacterized protein n=1 Tax=Stachybotrys chlorohalonatus (strain IBT 40285) TaxID=1283841 RepID=A0A084Q8F9_STAC4|nr:hypothetical protein S40285_08069 [Stachybotrys chlorohalonata IBT 40285]
MDMLPLHRFKTCRLSPDQYLSSTRLRYNPRENSTSPKRPRRLGRVIQDDTLHFMRLFNPLAERQVRLLRGAYPHLRQIQWPKVDHYPQGICYRQTSGPGTSRLQPGTRRASRDGDMARSQRLPWCSLAPKAADRTKLSGNAPCVVLTPDAPMSSCAPTG